MLAWFATDAVMASGGLTQSFLQPMGPVADEQFNHLLRVVGITICLLYTSDAADE